jgi:hypothetical protein
MRYALLINEKPGSDDGLSQAEREALFGEYMAIREECVDGARLQPAHTATTVRVHDGQVVTSDGPFADTKEVFGGYFICDADDLDKALDVAARIPAARRGGSVEVRPVVEY